LDNRFYADHESSAMRIASESGPPLSECLSGRRPIARTSTSLPEAIRSSVGFCDVLIAVIGKRWLTSRLDNPDDFVRLEIAAALTRNIQVIPVLVDGALMPRSSELPDDLKLLAWRNALEVSHNRFKTDFGRLVTAIEKVLQKAEAEHKRPARKERLEAQRHEDEEMQTLVRLKEGPRERLEFFRQEEELRRLVTYPRQKQTSNESDALAAFNRGLGHYNKKDFEKAISDYTEAISLNPNYALAYYNRGVAHNEKKEYTEATSDYTEAIRLNPDYAHAYYNRGVAHYTQGNLDKAISDYTEAIRLKADYPDAYNNRGIAYKSQGILDKADADFAKAAQMKKTGQ
jgi:tetratricopeptide (TPR) repeat protein